MNEFRSNRLGFGSFTIVDIQDLRYTHVLSDASALLIATDTRDLIPPLCGVINRIEEELLFNQHNKTLRLANQVIDVIISNRSQASYTPI